MALGRKGKEGSHVLPRHLWFSQDVGSYRGQKPWKKQMSRSPRKSPAAGLLANSWNLWKVYQLGGEQLQVAHSQDSPDFDEYKEALAVWAHRSWYL